MSTTSADEATPSTAELAVGGMHCSSCSALITETLQREPGIRQVTVDLDDGAASVSFDAATIDLEKICAVVAGLGYTAEPQAATGSAPALA